LESEAILTILKHIEKKQWLMIISEVTTYEISKITDPERRVKVQLTLSNTCDYVKVSKPILERAKQIQQLGIKSYDALHIACAEAAKVDVFLTTDDRLLKTVGRFLDKIRVKVDNPLYWIKEVL